MCHYIYFTLTFSQLNLQQYTCTHMYITGVVIQCVIRFTLTGLLSVPRSEVESAFQRLSSLLTVHTAKFSVLVTPLRATVLEVRGTSVQCHCPYSPSLSEMIVFVVTIIIRHGARATVLAF